MIILWTDALIYILVSSCLLAGIFICRKPHFQRPLKKISSSKTGVISLLFLLFFILIGLLDSVHFKETQGRSNEIISLLDYWAKPLTEKSEKTYSAPFSAYLYSKEAIVVDNDSKHWGYPRLKYGGSHLENPEAELKADVLGKALIGFTRGASLVILFMILLWSFLHDRHQYFLKGSTAKAVWLVVFLLVSITYMLIYLSAYYHVLGTDKVGEDVFYQDKKYSYRISDWIINDNDYVTTGHCIWHYGWFF